MHYSKLGNHQEQTSLHIRGAIEGQKDSLSWIVTRFSPFVRVQAEYRLRGSLRRSLDPEDLVHEVWLVVLPRLTDLIPRDEHFTPVLLKFLGTTLLHKVNQALTRHLALPRELRTLGGGEEGQARELSASMTSVLSRLHRDEVSDAMEEAIGGLKVHEREVLVLRGIEQLPNREVANTLGLNSSTVAMRYSRALESLRVRLPGSLFDELPDTDSLRN